MDDQSENCTRAPSKRGSCRFAFRITSLNSVIEVEIAIWILIWGELALRRPQGNQGKNWVMCCCPVCAGGRQVLFGFVEWLLITTLNPRGGVAMAHLGHLQWRSAEM